SELDLLSRIIQITTAGEMRVSQARQGIALNDPRLTDIERLTMSGRFERTNIATEIGAQRRVQIATSQGRLLDLLRVGGGGTTQAQSIIQGINSLQDAQRLRGLLNTPDTPIATTK